MSCKLLWVFFFINLFSVVDDDGGDEQSDSHWVILIDFCKYMTDAMRFLRSTTVDIKLFFLHNYHFKQI